MKKEHLIAIKKLKKENNSLKEYKEKVNTTVSSAVENERTDLGGNVLRQLADNLGVKINE